MKYLLMGTSSNFGNMFSMAGAFLFLPFLPMLPTQILLNNFLYDLAQVTIPTDNVDDAFIRSPQRWNIGIIQRFMLVIGPISSIYDFLTFGVLLWVFHASEALFQTGWFVESLATQTLVLFVIRTAGNPLRSRPSLPLAVTTLLVVLIGVILPFTPLAAALGFVPLPGAYFVFLGGVTLTYLVLVEVVKRRLMRQTARHGAPQHLRRHRSRQYHRPSQDDPGGRNGHKRRDSEVRAASPRLHPENGVDRSCEGGARHTHVARGEPSPSRSRRRAVPARKA